ncbi:MAG: hypothetical protein ACE5IR_17155 [bacterium]
MKSFRLFSGTLWLLLMPTASGLSHHQLGLPHYLYSKNYPQIPTMVIDADAEGYVVTFSIFPGNPRPEQTVRIKVYIKNKLTGEVYAKPIDISVSKETFLGGETEVAAPTEVQCDYNEYKRSYIFQEAEKYFINVTFEPRPGFFERIPFPVVIGQTNFNMVPIFFGAVFLMIFIGVGFTKKRQVKGDQ